MATGAGHCMHTLAAEQLRVLVSAAFPGLYRTAVTGQEDGCMPWLFAACFPLGVQWTRGCPHWAGSQLVFFALDGQGRTSLLWALC